jgi:hypothetical protein
MSTMPVGALSLPRAYPATRYLTKYVPKLEGTQGNRQEHRFWVLPSHRRSARAIESEAKRSSQRHSEHPEGPLEGARNLAVAPPDSFPRLHSGQAVAATRLLGMTERGRPEAKCDRPATWGGSLMCIVPPGLAPGDYWSAQGTLCKATGQMVQSQRGSCEKPTRLL